jgi:hypothetical protein
MGDQAISKKIRLTVEIRILNDEVVFRWNIFMLRGARPGHAGLIWDHPICASGKPGPFLNG